MKQAQTRECRDVASVDRLALQEVRDKTANRRGGASRPPSKKGMGSSTVLLFTKRFAQRM